MTDDILARAEQAMDGVTEGPWGHYVPTHDALHPDPVFGRTPGDEVALVYRRADHAFIAAAPQLVRDLISEVKRLRGGEA